MRERAHERGGRRGFLEIVSPDAGVLSDEDDLAHAVAHEFRHLVIDSRKRVTAIPSADMRNHAVRAEAIATIRDLDVGTRGIRVAYQGSVGAHERHVAVEQPRDLLDNVVLIVCREKARGLDKLGGEVVAVARRHATGDEHLELPASRVLAPHEVEDDLEALLHGTSQKRAGVDDDEIGIVGVVDDREAGGGKACLHLVGVDLVLGTAKRHEGDAGCAIHVHAPSGSWRTAAECRSPARAGRR